MPGVTLGSYEDPRYLQQVIEKLQKDVERLTKATIPVLASQRGPTPGWLTAGQIGPGAGTKSAMHLHLDGNQAGVAPRQTVTDAAGTVRAELGNLAANGISPAQFGFRANNAAGTPIFDSLGLIATMSTLVDTLTTANFTTGSTTPVVITNTTSNFTLPRAERVLFVWGAPVSYSGQTAFVDLGIDGVDVSNGSATVIQLNYPSTSSGAVTSTGIHSPTLAAGSHSCDVRCFQNGVTNMTVIYAFLLAYQLGS